MPKIKGRVFFRVPMSEVNDLIFLLGIIKFIFIKLLIITLLLSFSGYSFFCDPNSDIRIKIIGVRINNGLPCINGVRTQFPLILKTTAL